MHILAATVIIASVLTSSEACTAIGITAGASASGRVMLAHTDDAGGGAADIRLIPVPRKYLSGEDVLFEGKYPGRPVYHFDGGYPRVVTNDRGDYYQPTTFHGKEQTVFEPLGYVPDLTPLEFYNPEENSVIKNDFENPSDFFRYGYFDNDYGLMNEMHLSIVESTCGAKTVGWSSDLPYGYNMFGIAELSKVALERCITAKCAVRLMGRLAEKYGFYSEDSGEPTNPGYADSAEALILADRFDNVWVFNVLTGEKNASAIWAAQRVPDGHITAVANGLSIREVDFDDKENYMYSRDIQAVAKRLGFWKGGEKDKFDFTAIFGYVDPTPLTPLYIGRRVWRVYDTFAPSQEFNATLGSQTQVETYPFAITPDKKIQMSQVMNILKDHYEGTEFDMTKGVAAGPFGNPNRFPTNRKTSKIKNGGWERPISIFRSMFSFVTEIPIDVKDERLAILWYGQDKPHGTVYVPFSPKQSSVPESYVLGMQSEFDSKSAWRAFNFLNNWAMVRYDTISEEIRTYQDKYQIEAEELVESFHVNACNHQEIENKINEFAQSIVDRWWQIAWSLVAKYSDGYMITGEKSDEQSALGYPDWWLNLTTYVDWPGDSYTPPDMNPLKVEQKTNLRSVLE